MNNDKFAGKYRIPSTRASWWDYGNNGEYFITICTAEQIHFFGEIVVVEQAQCNGDARCTVETQNIASLRATTIGAIAQQYWLDIPKHFPFVTLDVHVVMPNHVHGIIIINKPSAPVETQNLASLPEQPQNIANYNEPQNAPGIPKTKNHFGPQSQNVGSIIRGYKSGVKTFATTNKIDFTWQSRFHDHIIRDDAEYRRIADYIVNNPANWDKDKFFSE